MRRGGDIVAMTEERRGASSGLRGVVDRMLELRRDEALETFDGVLRRRGGLHRRFLLVVAILGGARDVERSTSVSWRVTGYNERQRTGENIA